MATYVNPIDVRIRYEQVPENYDPHRGPRRGAGITWKNGGNSTGWVYAMFVAPANISNGKIRGAFKRWGGDDTTFTTKAYVDTVYEGDSIPEDTTGQAKNHSGLSGNLQFFDLYTGISANSGYMVLIVFAAYNIDSGDELVLHSIWLEY